MAVEPRPIGVPDRTPVPRPHGAFGRTSTDEAGEFELAVAARHLAGRCAACRRFTHAGRCHAGDRPQHLRCASRCRCRLLVAPAATVAAGTPLAAGGDPGREPPRAVAAALLGRGREADTSRRRPPRRAAGAALAASTLARLAGDASVATARGRAHGAQSPVASSTLGGLPQPASRFG